MKHVQICCNIRSLKIEDFQVKFCIPTVSHAKITRAHIHHELQCTWEFIALLTLYKSRKFIIIQSNQLDINRKRRKFNDPNKQMYNRIIWIYFTSWNYKENLYCLKLVRTSVCTSRVLYIALTSYNSILWRNLCKWEWSWIYISKEWLIFLLRTSCVPFCL